MDFSKQPIITIGDYELIYRPTEEYLEIENAFKETAFSFRVLQRTAGWGVFYAFFHILMYVLKVMNAPFAVIALVFLGLMLLIILGVDSFFAGFKIINSKNPLPKINRVPESDDLANWLLSGFLVMICAVHIYLLRVQKVSFESIQMLILSVSILILATPYYLKRFIKLLL